MTCKICEAPLSRLGTAQILGKYKVEYFKCPHCGFVQTEDPYWLNEAYSSAITSSDLGLVSRNLAAASISGSVISTLFNPEACFLDYGGGSGLYVRLMRDRGFDFYYWDKFAQPVFAKDFAANIDSGHQYELLTAFEVFEHLVDPLNSISQMLELSHSVLFSTTLVPSTSPGPQDWWYYGTEHGQHVGLFTHQALAHIAQRFGLYLYSAGQSLHLLTKRRTSQRTFAMVSHHRVATLVNLLLRRKSLLAGDYLRVVGRPLR
ncbi:MAG: class I SAM-dependent methyltransferase [Anaerolineae bacterium]|jgi:hypothetical protein|nr:class I SAM-dependent methyltransferase [Anaerolineae bacterium]